MAGTTPTYAFPYPTAGDTPAGHTQIQALAVAVENKLITNDASITSLLAGGQPKGSQVGYAEITTSSATWNSATKVVTNLTTTFTGITGAVYEIEADFTWQCATASNNDAFAIGWRLGGAGTVVNTDPIVGPRQSRSHPDGTGLNAMHLYGRFTAVASGTHCVAVIGWKPTGNTGATGLFCSNTGSNVTTNIIHVTRVA